VITNDDDDDAGSSSAGESLKPSAKVLPAVVATNICGDGILSPFEECDDSNRRDDDGCSSTCYSEIGVCGDGRIQSQLGEQCESAIHESTHPYGCSNCRNVSPTCNNGIQDPGEECDLGARNSNEPNKDCRRDCSLPRCGDSIIDNEFYEECDDGNRLNDDGCNRHCEKEESIEIAFSDTPKSQIAGEQISFIHSLSPQQQSQLLLGMNIPPTQSNIDLLKQGKIKLSDQQTMVLAQQMRSLHALPYQMPYQSPYQMPYQSSYQIPLAQLRPLVQSRGPIGDTGPAAVAVIGAGAAAGIGWMRRRKK
jgi:cysteine-rich repeat protein